MFENLTHIRYYCLQLATRLDHNCQTSVLGWTALHYASFCGHIRTMKLLLRRHGDASVAAADDQTPLHVALSSGCQRAAAYLVKRGSDVNAPDRDGLTPLHMCVIADVQTTTGWTESKRTQIVEFLLANGAMTCARNRKGETVLHAAVYNDVGEKTIALLAAKARERCSVDTTNGDGMTALHVANRPEVTRVLIGAGATVNASTNDGSTALHIHTDNPQLVSLLLDSGASRALSDSRGRIPLHVALDRSDPIAEVIELLSTTSSEVNAQDNHGMTPLHVLCSHTHPASCALDNGAKIPTDGHGIGAIMDRLIRQGADVDRRNSTGRTPLHLCIASRQFSKASLLLAHGADPHCTDRYGLTPYRMDTKWFRNLGHIERRVSAIRQESPPTATYATNGKRVTFSKETKKGGSSPDATVVKVTITEPSDLSRQERLPVQRWQKNRLTPHGKKTPHRSKPSRTITKHNAHPAANILPRNVRQRPKRERLTSDVTPTPTGSSDLPDIRLLPNWNDVVDTPRVMHTTAARRRVGRTRKAAILNHVSNDDRRSDDINGITREMNLILTH